MRLRDLLRTGPVAALRRACACRHGELALGLLQLRLVFVVFQPDDDLVLAHPVALIDADPFHLADDFGGDLDLVRGDDVARRIEHHALRRDGRR